MRGQSYLVETALLEQYCNARKKIFLFLKNSAGNPNRGHDEDLSNLDLNVKEEEKKEGRSQQDGQQYKIHCSICS